MQEDGKRSDQVKVLVGILSAAAALMKALQPAFTGNGSEKALSLLLGLPCFLLPIAIVLRQPKRRPTVFIVAAITLMVLALGSWLLLSQLHGQAGTGALLLLAGEIVGSAMGLSFLCCYLIVPSGLPASTEQAKAFQMVSPLSERVPSTTQSEGDEIVNLFLRVHGAAWAEIQNLPSDGDLTDIYRALGREICRRDPNDKALGSLMWKIRGAWARYLLGFWRARRTMALVLLQVAFDVSRYLKESARRTARIEAAMDANEQYDLLMKQVVELMTAAFCQLGLDWMVEHITAWLSAARKLFPSASATVAFSSRGVALALADGKGREAELFLKDHDPDGQRRLAVFATLCLPYGIHRGDFEKLGDDAYRIAENLRTQGERYPAGTMRRNSLWAAARLHALALASGTEKSRSILANLAETDDLRQFEPARRIRSTAAR